MGTISFDAAKIASISDDYDTLRASISAEIKTVTDNLSIISNPANWSGPIADSAKNELENASTALNSINSNMSAIAAILDDAAANFGKIKY